MEDKKYGWATLLTKFVENRITEVELVELYRQMGTTPAKLWQFDMVTESGYYRKRLVEALEWELNSEEDLKRFKAKLDAIFENKK